MATALLATKLFLPKAPRRVVARPRLHALLDRAQAFQLLLISAPAGFGKTTLLAEWLSEGPGPGYGGLAAAWLSLDRGDDHPETFWSYVIAAVRTVEPGVGTGELTLLQSPQPPPIEAVLATFLNDLAAPGRHLVLVLDDYHVIESPQVHEEVAFLLDHLPSRLHLALVTRADPPLPVARLRARGNLVEVRAADLRFTQEEAAAYLNEAMNLGLLAKDVAALEGRTEGWIAALQLAALSLQGRDDVDSFIAGFTGDDRYVIDYLAEEVLQRQPGEVHTFLIQTSILRRLTGPLCDAVTGAQGGKQMLGALDRGNLFLVPLDDKRRWYRYHQLFADVLRTRLLDEQPDRVGELHLRASRWYAANGDPTEAIRHAVAGEDFDHAADLIELAMPDLLRSRQEGTLRGLLEALPGRVVDVRPVLSVGFVAALLSTGQMQGVEAHLQVAERWLQPPRDQDMSAPCEGMVVADEGGLRRLPGAIALYRAGQARMLGDVPATVTHARRALELAGEDDHVTRAGAAALLGLASWTTGDLETGHRSYAEALTRLEGAGHLSDTLGCALAMADIRITQGRLGEAMGHYEQGLRRASASPAPAPALRGTADMHVGRSQLFLERNELDKARQQLLIARELGEHAGLPQHPYRWRVAMAGLRQADGDLEGALELIDEAEAVFTSDFSPEVRPVPAVRARIWVAQGRPEEALRWADARGLSTADELHYLREFEHATLARALLAHGAAVSPRPALDEATKLLERLLDAALGGQRTGSAIELLVLLALADQLRSDTGAALVALENALTLAEPEGYVRVFLDEGPLLLRLLGAAVERGIVASYAGRLLAAASDRTPAAPRQQRLVEPLSGRELDVLRLLATDLAGPQIARELVVSLNTVRTHTQRIYVKLGVSNRRLAVTRAKEMHLL